MNELVLIFPVIGVTFIVGAGIISIFRGYMKQRESISAVKEGPSAPEHGELPKAA